MRLAKIRIKHYRCFEDEEIHFDSYSCLVGPNGSGKSTVLMALNVFFRNTNAPSEVLALYEEDFFHRDTKEPIEITCTFDKLSDVAKEDLKAYVRQGQLTVTACATWNDQSQRAEVIQFGIRRVIEDFARYFEASDARASAADLKGIYSEIRGQYPELPAETTKDKMFGALREFEESRPDLCSDLKSGDQFYGWAKGANLLRKHISWVYLPAIKDPADEQDENRNTALGQILQRTVRSEVDFAEALDALRRNTNEQYRALIGEKNDVLQELQLKVEEQLKEWAHPGARVELNWHFDDQKSVSVAEPFARAKVGEGAFLGELVRSGHGMQRSFLVALLRVLENISDVDRPTLLLGFEEPELYQHPPQAKHLASLLERLSNQNTQVIVTTHSPYFVSSKGYEDIRLVVAPTAETSARVSQLTYDQLAKSLSAALGSEPVPPTTLMAAVEQIMQPSQTELFFCKVPVLVEGQEDIAFITTYLQFHEHWDDFRRLGAHFVPCSGKTNMSRPLIIAQALGLQPFVVFDGDTDFSGAAEEKNQLRDNSCLLELLSSDIEPLEKKNAFQPNFVKWSTRILDEVRSELGAEIWDTAEAEARETHQLQSSVKRKNPMLIAATLERLFESGHESASLAQLAENLLTHCRSL